MSASQDAPKCRVSSVKGVSSVKRQATAMLGKSCVCLWMCAWDAARRVCVCVCCVECVCVCGLRFVRCGGGVGGVVVVMEWYEESA